MVSYERRLEKPDLWKLQVLPRNVHWENKWERTASEQDTVDNTNPYKNQSWTHRIKDSSQREWVSRTVFQLIPVWSQVPDMDDTTWVHKKADDWLNEPGYQFHILPSWSSCLPTHIRQIKRPSILSTSHCIMEVSSSTRHTSGNTAEVTPMAQLGHSTFVGFLSNQAKSAKSWRYTWSYWASRSVSNLSEACSSKYEWWKMLKETQEWIVRGCYLSKGLKAADHARSSSLVQCKAAILR